MKRYRKRKCKHWHEFFLPDPRNHYHQRYCSKPDCRKASKVASQHRWLSKPGNRSYFRGPANVERVRGAWRKANPGYSKRKKIEGNRRYKISTRRKWLIIKAIPAIWSVRRYKIS